MARMMEVQMVCDSDPRHCARIQTRRKIIHSTVEPPTETSTPQTSRSRVPAGCVIALFWDSAAHNQRPL
jgi:hypothetical protein